MVIGGGTQFEKKRFSTMGEGDEFKPSVMSDIDRERLKKADEELAKQQPAPSTAKSSKQIVPYGNRVIVRKKKIGEKLGSIILASGETKDRDTDLAVIAYVPDLSFADEELISNGEEIVKALTEKARQGSAEALNALINFNDYLRIKALKVGDEILLGKYVGITFHATGQTEDLTLAESSEVIGVIR